MASPRTFGPAQGTLTLHTTRAGVASRIGHDLTLGIGDWEAVADAAGALGASSVRLTARLGSLSVVKGDGGVKPLSDKDKSAIVENAQKTLKAAKNPEVVVELGTFDLADGPATVTGTATIAGVSAPVTVTLRSASPGSLTATATIVQTGFGVSPYSAMLGALRVADEVEVRLELSGG